MSAAFSGVVLPQTDTSNGSAALPFAARCSVRNAFTSRTKAASGAGGLRFPSGSGPCSFRIGTAPSQRAARRIGRLAGQLPPTQIGTRGRCTGTGAKATSSTTTCSP